MPCGRAPVTSRRMCRTDAGNPFRRGAHYAGAADAHHSSSRCARATLPARRRGLEPAGSATKPLERGDRPRSAHAPAALQAQAQEAAPGLHPARHLSARGRLDRVRDADGCGERPALAREPLRVQGRPQLDPLFRRPRLQAAGQRRLPDCRARRKQEPDPARGGRDLAQPQERGHRDRGQALLRARGRGLRRHRPSARAGRAQAARRAGRLDDHSAVRQERTRRPGQPLRVPEAA